MTNSNDGMDWLDDLGDAEPEATLDPKQIALEGAASSARRELYNVVRSAFNELVHSEGLSRQELAERLGSSRALVSRWLGKPSNMTIESAAKLMYVMGRELKVCERRDVQPLAPLVNANRAPQLVFDSWCTGWNVHAMVRPMVVHSSNSMSLTLYGDDDVRMMKLSGCDDVADGLYEQIEAFNPPSTPQLKIRRVETPESENV